MQDFSLFNNSDFDRGATFFKESLWRLTSSVVFKTTWFHHYALKRGLLRMFGADVGKGVLIKPGVSITFPWRLILGDNVWIGENVWIDNLAPVQIASNVCISQGAYICTGSHDYKKEGFNLITRPVVIEESCWICAKSILGPGSTMKAGSILLMGSTASGVLEKNTIYEGVPALKKRSRVP